MMLYVKIKRQQSCVWYLMVLLEPYHPITSLNDFLDKGPNFTPNIFDILV